MGTTVKRCQSTRDHTHRVRPGDCVGDRSAGGVVIVVAVKRPGIHRIAAGVAVGRRHCVQERRQIRRHGFHSASRSARGVRVAVEDDVVSRHDDDRVRLVYRKRSVDERREVVVRRCQCSGCRCNHVAAGICRSGRRASKCRQAGQCARLAQAAVCFIVHEAVQCRREWRVHGTVVNFALVVGGDRQVRLVDRQRAVHKWREVVVPRGQRTHSARDGLRRLRPVDSGICGGRGRRRAGRRARYAAGRERLAADEPDERRGERRIAGAIVPAGAVSRHCQMFLLDHLVERIRRAAVKHCVWWAHGARGTAVHRGNRVRPGVWQRREGGGAERRLTLR